MLNHYDQMLDLTLDTQIKEEKDGYYAFEDTVFYGEKGGMLADQGTINGLKVLDLKWKGDKLYHKVDGKLSNPIHLQVDAYTRILNTTIQSALHLLDGFYDQRGLHIEAFGVAPEHQWYEVNSKEVDEAHLEAVQIFMNEALLTDIPTSFDYYKGSDYPDPDYAHHEEVRVVSFGEINRQPCATVHVNSTGQIGSFVVLGAEKTARGTRVLISVGYASAELLKKDEKILKNLWQTLKVPKNELPAAVEKLLDSNKSYKKQLEVMKKELLTYKAQELAKLNELFLPDLVEVADLRAIAQILLNQVQQTKILLVADDKVTHFALLSPDGQARTLFAALQEKLAAKGGGSPKLVTGLAPASKEELMTFLEDILH
ncbi:hypothetical protein [Streptococcus massiliensis]|uniref:Alanine--tRNA ligase n=1 Tax=Streptococcus massiliensis TaxID=313439 RepID=A0A380L106_9STRE|nr:hypothetical protein [Streptococcus massiliensis]SUN77034.1 alanine--tRNA ligase [Streptococcus massiliensis]